MRNRIIGLTLIVLVIIIIPELKYFFQPGYDFSLAAALKRPPTELVINLILLITGFIFYFKEEKGAKPNSKKS